MHPYLLRFTNPVTGVAGGVSTYALCLFLGSGAAIALTWALGRRRGIPGFNLLAVGGMALGGGLLGAKAFYLALNGPEVVARWGWHALLSGGGFVWYGGLLGGAAAVLLYARAYGLPKAILADLAAPGLALGQAFGRVGCFSAGCCYGRPAPGFPLAVVFPPGAIAPAGVPRYPTQLFEAVGLVILVGILLALILRRPAWRAGAVFWTYLMAYAALRYVLEIYRGDDRGPRVGPFSPSQVIALGVLLAGGVVAGLALTGRRRVHAASRR